MVAIVLVLGVVNLGFGFALAILLERSNFVPVPAPGSEDQVESAKTENAVESAESNSAEEDAESDPVEEIWARLEQEGIEATSFVEAVLWTVRLELPRYRQELLTTEQRHRRRELATLEKVVSPSQAWYERLSTLVDQLTSSPDDIEQRGVAEEILLDNIFQVQAAIDRIERLHEQEDVDDELTGQVCTLIEAGDNLRDLVDGALAEILRSQQRLDQITQTQQHPEGSQAFTRLGLETLFHDWWTADEDRVRLVSCVLLDLDRFGQVNELWGTEIGDAIIGKFDVLLQDLLRKGRGFDRVAYLSGQTFLLFLGDTAIHNASSGAERIRQSIEAASFRVEEKNIEFTASCGVIGISKSEQISDFVPRLKASVAAAKAAGRNRSFADDGSGPQAIDLPQFQVQGRVIDVVQRPRAAVQPDP